jgi:Domain of unknown function (DUF4279)
MAHISKSVASLRLMGDDLIPAEISKILGSDSTSGHFKGEVILGKTTGREYIKKFGFWRLKAKDAEPENLDGQVAELLSKLTKDLAVWTDLKSRFEIDLFCGLFMDVSNEGFELSSVTLASLAERGIAIGFDIYGPSEEGVGNE